MNVPNACGATLLYNAVLQGKARLVHGLLVCGADMHVINHKSGRSPLDVAQEHEQEDRIFQILMAHMKEKARSSAEGNHLIKAVNKGSKKRKRKGR